MDLKKCESCGMMMTRASDFGGRDQKNRFCSECTYGNGQLKPRFEIREKLVLHYMKARSMERMAAERFVDEMMARNPEWQ